MPALMVPGMDVMVTLHAMWPFTCKAVEEISGNEISLVAAPATFCNCPLLVAVFGWSTDTQLDWAGG